MDNPTRIVQTLDAHLAHPVRLAEMKSVELVELRDAFNCAKPLILKAAETINPT